MHKKLNFHFPPYKALEFPDQSCLMRCLGKLKVGIFGKKALYYYF